MLILLLQLFANLIFLAIVLFMVLAVVKGAPYVRSKQEAIQAMLELAPVSQGDQVLDFGAGDGQLVLAFAKAGAGKVRGVEINPFLAVLANLRIALAGKWSVARVYWGNMWWFDTSPYSLILVYGFPNIMSDLENKLINETRESRVVVSNAFEMKNLSLSESKGKIKKYSLDHC